MPTYGIVYATVSKALRRIVIPQSGTAVGGISLAPGESMLPVVAGNNDQLSDWETKVFNATGIVPPILTCALIDNTDTVQGIICADPAIDVVPPAGFSMVATYSPLITIGCTYNSTTGLFTAPGYTIPPNTIQNPTALPVVVPPTVIPNPESV